MVGIVGFMLVYFHFESLLITVLHSLITSLTCFCAILLLFSEIFRIDSFC
jgi:hypothetical protein